MIRFTDILLEILTEKLPDDILKHKIQNPRARETGKDKISVGWALKQPKASPTYRAAIQYLVRYKSGAGADFDIPDDWKQAGWDIQMPAGWDMDEPDTTSSDDDSPRQVVDKTKAPKMSPEEVQELYSSFKEDMANGKLNFNIEYLKPDPMYGIGDDVRLSNEKIFDGLDGLEEELKKITDAPPENLLKMVKGIADSYGEGLEKDLTVRLFNSGDRSSIAVTISDRGSSDIGNMSINFPAGDEPYLYGSLLTLRSGNTGLKTRSAGMIGHAMEACDTMGITRIKFEAALSSGGYMWAKMGGTPVGYSISRMANLLKTKLSRTDIDPDNSRDLDLVGAFAPNPKVGERMKRKLKNYKDQGTLETHIDFLRKAVFELENDPSMLVLIANHEFGRYFLEGTTWNGQFDITPGSESRELINTLTRS